MMSKEHDRASTPDERAARAFAMRQAHVSWPKIAAALGYSAPAGAIQAATRHGLRVSPASQAQRDAARPTALEHLEQVWSLVEPELGSANAAERDAAIGRALKIIDLYARWLDVAPSQTPPSERLARYGMEVRP